MKEKDQGSLQSWVVVFTAGAFFFYSFIQMTLFSTDDMKEYFMGKLSVNDPAEFGNFAGTFIYGTVLFLIPIGVFLDKVSVKHMILAMLGLVVLCTFGLVYTDNIYVAIGLRVLCGMAHCVAFMAPFRLAPRWFPSRQLALVAGLLVTFAVFGGWVSSLPMLKLIEQFGAETTMLINGGLGILILLAAVVLLRDFPEGYEAEAKAENELSLGQGLAIAARNKQNWLAGLYIGLLNLAVLVLAAVWGTTYLKSVNQELDNTTITLIVGMILFGTMIGSPLWGIISDKLQSRKLVMIGGGILSLAVMLLIMFPPSSGAFLLYALFLLLGIVTAAQSVGYPVIAESNEDKVLGTANSLAAVVLMGMGAVAVPVFGKLIGLCGGGTGATPLETQEAFAQAIWVMPVAFIVAIICAFLMNETFKREA